MNENKPPEIYRSIHWLGENWFGLIIFWPPSEPFPSDLQNPMCEFIAKSLKCTVLTKLGSFHKIENEQIKLHPPIKDEKIGIELPGSIGWRAEIFWETL